MAKTSGSNHGAMRSKDTTYRGKIENERSLSTLKHNEVFRELKQGISKYESRLGLRVQKVMLADLNKSTLGVGGDGVVHLNAKHFDTTKNKIIRAERRSYDMGHSTVTNKPIQHTLIHELAHNTWQSNMTGTRQKAASVEIKKVYNEWKKDKNRSRKGYGTYAASNINEFYAETVTKGVIGKSDKYTKKIIEITKKYKL